MSQRSFEDLSAYRMDDATLAELLGAQTECTFAWVAGGGWPRAVTMTFVHDRGRFWLSATTNRGRIGAVRRDPRVSLVVSSTGTRLPPGKSVTYRGTVTVHDDRETLLWFLDALGLRRFPDDAAYRAQYIAGLDSPNRVVLEVTPVETLTFDGARAHPGTHWDT